MEKLFDKLPYDFLQGVKLTYILMSAVGVGALFLAIYYFTLFTASQDELAQLQQKRTKKEQTLKAYQGLVKKKEPIAKELARTLGELEFMKQQLPREDDMPDLLQKVADFGGGRVTFDVTRFKLKEGNVKDFYKKIPVEIQMQGSFWDTLDFLDKMQNLLQLVTLTDLKMNLGKAQGGAASSANGTLIYTNFVANTYAYIQGAEEKAK